MSEKSNLEPKIDLALLNKFWSLVEPYWRGDLKKQAWGLLLKLILFIALVAGVNAYKTYITKWATDALNNKDEARFYWVITIAVISLAASVPVDALKLYYQNKLALFWRKWFNLDLLKKYFNKNAYYNMNLYSDVDNPDQRIAEDLNNFVNNTTEFFSISLTSFISILAYVGVLASISYKLVITVFLYATVGTFVIVWLSTRLIKLNFKNIKLQANYRYNLVHVRDNIESIAFYQGEKHESSVLVNAFNRLFENYNKLIILQRNISFFSQAYTLFSALFPFMMLAPLMFAGKIEVGTVLQASTVFTILLNDLSVIVNQFQNLSMLAATTQRISGFVDGIEAQAPQGNKLTHQQSNTFEFKDVTVETPQRDKTLVKHLNLTLPTGKGMMIVGASGCGKSSLLRAIAGLWQNGQGQMHTPNKGEIMFLPQKPYMLIGSLKEQILYPHLDANISDDVLHQGLAMVGLEDLVPRVGSLDAIMGWSDLLSLGEQQRVIFLRLLLTKPKFAILDESTSALDEPNEAKLYKTLQQSDITYISVGHRSTLIDYHDITLQLQPNHKWHVYTQQAYKAHLAEQKKLLK